MPPLAIGKVPETSLARLTVLATVKVPVPPEVFTKPLVVSEENWIVPEEVRPVADKVPAQDKLPEALAIVQPVELTPPANRISPVEVLPIETVPVPLASIVKFSLVPVEITDKAKPEAAAAEVIFKPVTAEVALVSTCKA